MNEEIFDKIDSLIKILENHRGSTAIKMDNVKGVSIVNNQISGFDTAIDAKSVQDLEIINNQIKTNQNREHLIQILKELEEILKTDSSNKSRIKSTLSKLKDTFGFIAPVAEIILLISKVLYHI